MISTIPVFTAEPNNNKVSYASIKRVDVSLNIDGFDKLLYLEADYHHSGFPSNLKTVFRLIKELAFEKRPALFLEFDFINE